MAIDAPQLARQAGPKSTPPLDAMLLGACFMIVGVLVASGGLKMGSSQPVLVIGGGAVVAGLGLGLTGLIRWIWSRRR